MKLLQQSPYRFRRVARPAGRFDTAALNDEERALFLEPSDRTAHFRRFESFPGLNVLNGQALAGFGRIASGRQHPFYRRVLFKIVFADFLSETLAVTVSVSIASNDLAINHSTAILSCEGSNPVDCASCSVWSTTEGLAPKVDRTLTSRG